jgi:Na+/proline symporter
MWVVVLSFAAYTLAIVLLGLYSARYARRSNEDFFLAGRSLGAWVAALSASASSESGWVTLGLVGWAYTNGVQAYWIIPGCLLGYLFNWFVLAGRMSDHSRALNALTLPDFFAFHFRERWPLLRVLSVVVILVAMVLYVAAQFAAAGKAFAATFTAETFNITYQQGVWLGAAIVLIYPVSGGFRAVCWTDFLQALLMVGTLVLFPVYLLMAHGGYGFVTNLLAPVTPPEGQAGDLLRFSSAGPGRARVHRIPARRRRAGHQLRLSRPAARAGAVHGAAQPARSARRRHRLIHVGFAGLLGRGDGRPVRTRHVRGTRRVDRAAL